MRILAIAAGFAMLAGSSLAEPVRYDIDKPHAQIVFSWSHFGFAKNTAMFAGFDGVIMFDEDEPTNSSVEVSIPVMSVITGSDRRNETFQDDRFFDSANHPNITFKSTSIHQTALDSAYIHGDLTIRGTTLSVTLDAVMRKKGTNPVYKKEVIGFEATTTLLRTDYGVSHFAPAMGDSIDIHISIEGVKHEEEEKKEE